MKMMNKLKKEMGINSFAFTLVELVAVILILALFAMIAMPVVTNVVAESKKNAFGVTCRQVYRAVEKYVNFEDKSSCIMFDFEKEITQPEMIDGVNYLPLTQLDLTGALPNAGGAKFCGGKIEVTASDGTNTCVLTDEFDKVLSGTLEEVDTTRPEIKDVTLTSTSYTVKVVVNALENDGKIAKYKYSLDGKEYVESDSMTHVFTGLKSNTEYTVFVQVENESGLFSKTTTKKIKTKYITSPKIEQVDPKPEEWEYEYARKRVIKINYIDDNIEAPIYYFRSTGEVTAASKDVIALCGAEAMPGDCITSQLSGDVVTLEAGTWYKANSNEIELTYTNYIEKSNTLYALLGDGIDLSIASTYVVENIDSTDPITEISVGTDDIKTDRAKITANCYDNESKIVKYEYSKDGINWVDGGLKTSHLFEKLEDNTVYSFSVRCTNGAGISTTATSSNTTKSLENPGFENTSNIPSEGYNYYTSRTYKIIYKSNDIVSPEYYFKTDVDSVATVSGDVIIASCGNGVDPSSCTSVSGVTTLRRNTWYKTTKTSPVITYTANGTLYAATSDGTNLLTSTNSISNLDISAPDKVELKIEKENKDGAELNATCIDSQSGITKYEFSHDNGKTWKDNGTSNKYTFTGLAEGQEYMYTVRCTNGSKLSKTAEGKKVIILQNPSIELISKNPSSGYSYYQSKTIKINYGNTGLSDLEKYIKINIPISVPAGTVISACGTGTIPGTCNNSNVTTLSTGVWYKVSSQNVTFTYTDNNTLYIYATAGTDEDGTKKTFATSLQETNMDTTKPSVKVSIDDTKTDRATVVATCLDNESNITKYEFKIDNGSWVDKGLNNTHEFTGLKPGTEYTYTVRCTNGSGMEDAVNDKGVSAVINAPTYTNTVNSPNKEGYSYYTSRTYRINYDDTGIVSPVYYFKTNVSGVTVNESVYSCGGTLSTTCSQSKYTGTTLEKDVWYKVTTSTPSLTMVADGTIYAVTSDGTNISTASTNSVTNIDTTKPELEITGIRSTTNSFVISYTASDAESNIKSRSCLYGTSASSLTQSGNITETNCTLSNLKAGITYYYKITVENGSGLISEITNSENTEPLNPPTFTNTANTPSSGYSYYTNRTYKITYDSSGITSPVYYFKTNVSGVTVNESVYSCGTALSTTCSQSKYTGATLEKDVWYKTTTATPIITLTANGTIYALTGDGTNISSTSTYGVTEIDTTKPDLTITSASSTSNTIIISYTASDAQSNIASSKTTCVYGTSASSMTSNGTVSGTSCVLSGLKPNTTYYYKITVRNGAGVPAEATDNKDTLSINPPTFTNTANVPSDDYTYYTSRTYRINYDTSGITNPVYYFKSNVDGVKVNVTIYSCGSTIPTTCSSTRYTGTLVKDVWYRAESTPSLTLPTNGTIYAATGDGVNASVASTYGVTNIDTSAPSLTIGTATVKTDSITIPFTASDGESNIKSTACVYGVDTNYGSNGAISGTNCNLSKLEDNRTYYYKITTTNNAGVQTTKTGTAKTAVVPTPSIVQYSQNPASGTAISKVMRITYSTTNMTSATYYYSLNGTTWTKVSSSPYDVTFTVNGKLYARIVDGTGNTTDTSVDVTGLDSEAPKITVTKNASIGYKVTIAITDNVGAVGYRISSSSSTTEAWINFNSTTSKSIEWTPATYGNYGTYYAWAIDAAGNTNSKSFTIEASSYDYAATPTCTDGRTLSNGNCVMSYTNNESQCGCSTYNTCTSGACGVESYKSCANSACGYATCPAEGCGVASYKSCATSGNGCKTYNSCEHSSCGAKSCATSACGNLSCPHSACGCSVYNTCTDPSFGCASYKSCQASGCGYATCEHHSFGTKSCQAAVCGYASCTHFKQWDCQQMSACERGCLNGYNGSSLTPEQYSYCMSSCNAMGCDAVNEYGPDSSCGYASCTDSTCGYYSGTGAVCGYKTCPDSSCGCSAYNSKAASPCSCKTYKSCENSACGYKTCEHSSCGYKSCPNSSCTCAEYVTAPNSACGVASYNSCQNSACGYATCSTPGCGVESYSSCATSACGCKTASSCTKTENDYRKYTCPKGGKLSGTMCKFGI